MQVLPYWPRAIRWIIAAVSDPRVEEMSAGVSYAARPCMEPRPPNGPGQPTGRHLAGRLRNLGIEVVDAGPAELARRHWPTSIW